MNKTLILSLTALALLFTSCNNGAVTTQQPSNERTSTTPSIVYVDVDSLVQGYTMYKELNADFVKKAEKIQKELETKATAFQRNVQSYEQKVRNGLVTTMGAAEIEKNLQKEQQDLIQYRDEVTAKMAEEEAVMVNQIKFNIKEYIAKYNLQKGYDLILSTSAASNTVLIGNPSLNITIDVMNGLNTEYVPVKK